MIYNINHRYIALLSSQVMGSKIPVTGNWKDEDQYYLLMILLVKTVSYNNLEVRLYILRPYSLSEGDQKIMSLLCASCFWLHLIRCYEKEMSS